MTSSRLHLGLLTSTLVLGLSLAACKDKGSESVQPDTAPKTTEDLSNKDPSKGQIELGERLAKLCDMPNANFAFDSSSLSAEAASALDTLAKCLTTGAAKDESLRVVGHADPRGEEEYNFGLGQRRAGSVASHLEKRGVATDRMETSSRGELEAKGTDEASWASDRKVQILLAD